MGGIMGIEASQPTSSAAIQVDLYPEDIPSVGRTIALGFQHVLAMFGATVLGPLLMGFDPNVAIMFSGVATLLFYVLVGGKVPSYLGSSFAFIAAVSLATGYSGTGPNPNIAIALGGIFAAGALYALIGLLVQIRGQRWINKLFPPVISGVIVGIIGLNLSRVAVGQIGGELFGVVAAIITLAVATGLSVYGRGFLRQLSILVAGVVGYAFYFAGANLLGFAAPIDFSTIAASPLFGIPAFRAPIFDLTAIILIAPVAIILIAENLGHIRAIDAMTGRPLDRYLGRAFLADGIGTMLSASGGGTGVTTYAENIGVMRATSNFASITFVAAGVIAIFLGFSPLCGAVIRTIPLPVLGGLALVLFGLITATSGVIWQRGIREGTVDFGETRTLVAVGIGLVIGAGDLTIRAGQFAMGGIVTATVAVLLIYHLLGLGAKPPAPTQVADEK